MSDVKRPVSMWVLHGLVVLINLALLTMLLVSVCGCVDDRVPADPSAPDAPPVEPVTWRYAEQRWADAWCSYAERCYPPQFENLYHDHGTCEVATVAINCHINAHGCDTLFPLERLYDLGRCRDQMQEISCLATEAPNICLVVWQ